MAAVSRLPVQRIHRPHGCVCPLKSRAVGLAQLLVCSQVHRAGSHAPAANWAARGRLCAVGPRPWTRTCQVHVVGQARRGTESAQRSHCPRTHIECGQLAARSLEGLYVCMGKYPEVDTRN